MGGHPYQYRVPYQANLQTVLDGLRRDVFERGEYWGADARPRTIAEAVDRSGESGTRSILDIERISATPDYSCAAPLTNEELQRYFGTQTPTAGMVEGSDALWEDLDRGQARCVIVYDGGTPREIVFVGYSYD